MRKHILPILLVLLMVLLVGCSHTNELPKDTEISSSSVGEFSELKQDENLTDEPTFTITESTASSTENKVVTEPTVSRENEDKKPTSSVSKPTEEPEKTPEISETKPTQSQTEKTETEKKPTETQPVKQPEEKIPETTKLETTVPSTEQTKPTEDPKPEPETQATETTEPTKAFDIDYWISSAKNYAQSKGLVLDAAAVDCWDNPIRAGSHCIYLERDIQSRLNRYANDEDITDVWIWVESVGNDCYDIYIGYA